MMYVIEEDYGDFTTDVIGVANNIYGILAVLTREYGDIKIVSNTEVLTVRGDDNREHTITITEHELNK